MHTVTTIVYYFDELGDAAKERAREWWRDTITSDSSWSECVTDDARAALTAMGYTITGIFWRGFSSQGDGACFTGTFNASARDAAALAALRADRPNDTELHVCMDKLDAICAAFPDLSATLTHRGRYYHEQSVTIDCDSDAFAELSRDLMREIYIALERAYDWENGTEQVDDNIRANAYEFTADGTLSH
jgi:hypothetical protein